MPSRTYFANANKLGRRLNLMCDGRAAIHGDFYARTRAVTNGRRRLVD